MAFGLNFGKSKSESSDSIWAPQAAGLQQLYTGAQDFFGAGSPYLDNALSSGATAIPGITGYASGAMPAWSNLMGGGSFGGGQYDVSGANPMANAQGAGFGTYESLMNPQGNPYLNAMFGAGAGNMVQNWQNNIMPQIGNNSEMAGGYGGSRQGIAEGLSMQGLMDSISDFGANLYGGQYQSDMNRALGAASGYNQDQLAAINQNRMIGQGTDQVGIQALGQGANAMNLGFSAPNMWNQLYGMQWSPYANFANVMGQPTVLGQSEGSSEEYGFKF